MGSEGQGPGGSWRDREPPPPFDGRNPERSYERWLKDLKLWEYETEIPKSKWGVKLLRQLSGSAKAAAEGLSFEEIACEEGKDNILRTLQDHFAPHLETSLPKAFEAAIYGEVRGAKEFFGDYVIRMEHAFTELERKGVKLHESVTGYVMFRQANLNETQESQMLTWGAGKYDRKTVVTNLRKLDKALQDGRRRGNHYLMEGEYELIDEDEVPEVYAQGFEEEPDDSDGDEDYVYIGEGEMQDIYEESELQEALATYQDVRRSLREQKNSRGYYPVGKASAGGKGVGGASGKGKGKGKQRPTLAFKNRDQVKFTKDGQTRVHVDMLKLRTKCARCGAVGHWARECKNPPDERGRLAASQRTGTSSSSQVAGSSRSGFFVQSGSSSSDFALAPSFYATAENGVSCSFLSSMPTFGSILRKIAVSPASVESTPACQASTLRESSTTSPMPFVGVVTGSNEGIVDTAAQDGLIGKAALLRFAETLRGYGLKIRWNTSKKAQACGVGGKATVIGIAEVPIGIAGVNGLIELTVVTDNVPMLLPIRMLKNLRAVVDLDTDVLELKAFGVKAPMHQLPSGHMSVSVVEFAPEGWSVPNAASNVKQPEQFTFLLQSMTELEQSSSIRDPPFPSEHGERFAFGGKDDGTPRTGETAPTTSSCRSAAVQEGYPEMASSGRETSRFDAAGPRPRTSKGLASRLLLAAFGASIASGASGGAVSYYPAVGKHFGGHGPAVGVRGNHQVCVLPWSASKQRTATSQSGDVFTSTVGTEGGWQPTLQGDLLRPVQGPLGIYGAGQASGEEEAEGAGSEYLDSGVCLNRSNDCGQGGMSLQEAGQPVASEERGPDERQAFLALRPEGVQLLPVGFGGAGEDRAEASSPAAAEHGDRGPGADERPDLQHPGPGRSSCGAADAGDKASVPDCREGLSRQAGGPGAKAPDRDAEASGADGLDAEFHATSASVSDGAAGRLPHGAGQLDTRGLPDDLGLDKVSLVSSGPQLQTARKLQMRAFCSRRTSLPWSMPLSRVYYEWSHNAEKWVQCCGWLPKVYDGVSRFLVVYENEESMVAWCEDYGKVKALSQGQRKRADGAAKIMVESLKVANAKTRQTLCWEEIHHGDDCTFWEHLRRSDPEMLVLSVPHGNDTSAFLARACDAAEWQAVREKSFVIFHAADVVTEVQEGLSFVSETGQLAQQDTGRQVYATGNCVKLVKAAVDVWQSGLSREECEGKFMENVNSFPQNQEGGLNDKNETVRYSDKFLENVDSFPQNQEGGLTEENEAARCLDKFRENVDSFPQNQEGVHLDFMSSTASESGGIKQSSTASESGGSNACLIASKDVDYLEWQAGQLLRQKDFSFTSFEKFMQTWPSAIHARQRPMAMSKGEYFYFGLYSHGGSYGVTSRSRDLPQVVRYLNSLMKYQCECQGIKDATWTSIGLGVNAGSDLHRDVHNKVGAPSFILGAGRFRGGELWTANDPMTTGGKAQNRVLPDGTNCKGSVLPIQYQVQEFSPKDWHASCSWTGTRLILTAYTSRGVDQVDPDVLKELQNLKFVIPKVSKVYMFDGSVRKLDTQAAEVFAEVEEEEQAQGVDVEDMPVGVDNVEPTEEEKRLVKKLHENMGHPAPRDMARSLRIAHAKPHVIRYVAKEFRCSVCESRPRPKPAKPAVLPKSYEPGRVIGVDVIFLSSLDKRETFPALNMVDWGTGYQMIERLKNMESDHAWRTFLRVWGRVFGIPEILVADLGNEFRGQFVELASQAGALVRHTAARSPWQAGKTERAGAHFKHVFERARDMAQISSWEELKTLLYEVEGARNRYGNRSGFSPMQRQIGHSLRLPASLLSDDHLDPGLVVQSAGDEMRRVLEIRQAAQEAYMKSQTELAITRAKNARVRPHTQYLPGETVYVFRRPRERKRKHAMTEESHEGRKPTWVGPGVVLAVELPSLWVSMKGELWKVSVEQCRHATSEEQMAKELLMGELEALREELGRDTQKRTYKDMTEEQGPAEDEDGENALERGLEWVPGERPNQRQRILQPEEVPVPEDGRESVLSYQPSLGPEEEEEGTNEAPVVANDSEASSNLQPTIGEPEPWPSPEPVMHPMAVDANPLETAATVMRNERLDGNLPGSAPYEAARRIHRLRPEGENRPYVVGREEGLSSSAWFSLEDGKWRQECDVWEVVDKNMVIRHHSEPREALCNPTKVKGALLPRRLKHRQTFMILENGEVETQHDNWFKNRRQTKRTGQAWTGFTVFSSQVVDPAVFASSKPRGQGEIYEHEIKKEEWGAWKETDRAEWDKVTMTDAVRVLSLEESREVRATLERQNQLDRILPSRMVRRWKPSEQPGSPPTRKSRWCIRGDRDPDLLSLQRYAPTLNTTSFGVLLQVAASMRYRASVGDLKNAFCQSSPLKRDNGKLYASQPKAGIEGLHPEQIVEIIAGCYGLGDAPAHWRRTLKKEILALGYKESVLDPTVYMLHEQDQLHGAIAVEIDDLFSFGSELHYQKMDLLRQRFVFGKFEMVDESLCGVGFNGRRVRQLPDRSFSVDMEKFIGERLDPVALAKGRKAEPKSLANASEVAQLRAVIGALAWAAKEGRPDAAAAASLGAGSFPRPTVQDIIDINKTVRLIKSNPSLSIKIRAVPLQHLAGVSFQTPASRMPMEAIARAPMES